MTVKFQNHQSDTSKYSVHEFLDSDGDKTGKRIVLSSVEGGPHHGAIGLYDGEVLRDSAKLAGKLGIPYVIVLDTSGADISKGPNGLHAWGIFAHAITQISGVVPIITIVKGACVSGPSLVLGLADFTIFTEDSFAYVSGPEAIVEVTGMEISKEELGGPKAQSSQSGVASLLAKDEAEAIDLVEALLDYLPNNNIDLHEPQISFDEPDRKNVLAKKLVPKKATESYDVREVVKDICDEDTFFEIRDSYATNMVTAFALFDGISVAIIANQPMARAGTLDIEASKKAAAHVQIANAFNIPIVTFVDTPGFEPGKDLEWRGMIRHGAELVFAYAQATVPRLGVILRKSYGGAYIVMDSKTLGNDWCGAWPDAEIAVMGAQGAVQILYRREILALETQEEQIAHAKMRQAEYEEKFSNPSQAASRGYVDEIIEPEETREKLIGALQSLVSKKHTQEDKIHSNTPL